MRFSFNHNLKTKAKPDTREKAQINLPRFKFIGADKKAQITLFIIIGIIILFSTAIVLYIKSKNTVIPEVDVPSDVRPVHDYITQCVKEVSKQGLIILGEQGGYINIPRRILMQQAYLSPDGAGIVKMPYWYYYGENRIPPEDFVVMQLENYTETNLNSCLQNFSSLQDKFIVKGISRVKAKATLADENVIIDVYYRVSVKNKAKGKEKTLDRYVAVHPVKLKKILEFANSTMVYENTEMFLEKTTIDFMAMHPDIPFTDLIFSCRPLVWKVSEVKQNLQDLLYYNFPRIRFDNTNYQPFSASSSVYEKLRDYTIEDLYKGNYPDIAKPDDAYDYFHLFYKTTNKKYPFLIAKVIYNPDWGMTLRSRPSSGGLMKSNAMKGAASYLRFLCLNLYHFTYDVQYPVMFVLKQPDAFAGEGYTFKFTTPVIIDHNQGNRVANTFSFFTGVYDNVQDYCNDRELSKVYIKAKGIKHNTLNQPLKNVNVSYDCFRYKCYLGKTDTRGMLETSLPKTCSFGFIEASVDGYLKTIKQYDGKDIFNIELPKLQEFNVTVVKNKDGNPTAEMSLINNEMVLISLVSNEYDYSIFTVYNKSSSMLMPLIYENTNYTLDLILFDPDNNDILGGYRGVFVTTYDEMYNKTQLKFHVKYPSVMLSNRLEFLSEFYSNISDDSLRPEFMD